MKRKLCIFSVLLAAAGIAAYFFFFAEKEESKIKRAFGELSATVRKSGNEGMLVSLEKAKTASKFFDEICTLKLENIPQGVGRMSRDNIASNTAMLRKYFDRMDISFYDMEIFVESDGAEARMTFTAVFNGSGSGRKVEEPREMDAELVKKGGRWLIRSLAFREVIQK